MGYHCLINMYSCFGENQCQCPCSACIRARIYDGEYDVENNRKEAGK